MPSLRPLLVLMMLLAASVLRAAPVVVETDPPNGARDVDPTLEFIRVTFSEPMSQNGWSWCGGGYAYPEVAAAPFFEDERTAVLPVKLEPQHSYTVSVNCPSAENFRSADGAGAERHVLRFTTGWGDPLLASTDPQNLAAYNTLVELLAGRYSYVDRTGYDWRAALEGEKDHLLNSPNPTEWAVRLLPLLEPFHDKHLRVIMPDGESVGTWHSPGRYNANPAAIERRFGPLKHFGKIASTGGTGDVAYLAIHTWSGDRNDTHLLHQILDKAQTKQVIILDVRGNGGGDELQAREIAARFLKEGEGGTYARNRIRDPEAPDGWTPWYDRVVKPAPAEKHVGARVLLLQGPVCLSSNESFIKMMKLSPRVRTFGATTGGSSARPQRHSLPNGIEISLPTWWTTLPDGTPLEGNGIPPDIAVDGDFVADDPVLVRALEEASLK